MNAQVDDVSARADAVRVAVLGTGRIGRMHAELLKHRIAGASLACVSDVDARGAESLAAALDVPTAAVDRVLERDDVDAVAICTSTDSHADLIHAAAASGRAIFCEKPIAMDLAVVDGALDAVAASGVKLHVGFNRRFDPAHASVREAVVSGALGQVELVRITSRDPAPPPIEYVRTSGGLFLDMTSHDFDMARFVVGSEVVDVVAHGTVRVDQAIGEAGDIDTAVVVLRHADGCLTTIDNSRRAVYGYDQRVEAFGSGGMASSINPTLYAGSRFDAGGEHRPALSTFFIDRYEASYVRAWEAFVAYVVGDGPSPVSGDDGRAPLVIGLAAMRSLAERRPVGVAEIDSRVAPLDG
jgi:myo-inositol 2-dehydrogenase / D-chiro-inositol 1-dehydrogenase